MKGENTTVQKRHAGDDHRNGKYGFFGCTPSFIQWLNSPAAFLVLLLAAMIGNTAAVVGTLITVLPHIEKRFNLSGFDSGMIAAANDVPAVIVGLFVAHYGHYSNKVRWIGIGGIITGVGLFICTLPHYIIGKYQPTGSIYPLCDPSGNLSKITCEGDEEIAPRYHLALILIGQIIAGVGTVPMFSFPPAIFRETLKAKYVPMFLGLWQASVFAGPLFAFIYAEPILETWVEPGDEPEGITPLDPRFVSAWWIGFLGPACLCAFIGVIILGFPEHIKTQLNDAELEQIKKIDDTDRTKSLKDKMTEIPRILKELLTNWTYVFNSLAFNSTLMFAEGLSPFIAKILFLRFGVALTDIGKILNVAFVPPLILGVAFSVVLLRFVKIEESGKKSAFICFILQFGCFVPPLACLLPGCDIVEVAGHVVPYGVRKPVKDGLNLTKIHPTRSNFSYASTCNDECHCSLGFQLPVCGTDGVTYLTPCHAGCTDAQFEIPLFTNCSCIWSNDTYGGEAKVGFCDRHCKNWLEFVICCSVFSLVAFAQLSPSKVVVMRAVKAEHLSLAFALHYLSNKILANIPGPILFGHVVDLSCDIWQRVCGETGYCMIYDVDHMMLQVAITTGSLGAIGLASYFMSWVVYKEADPSVVVKEELPIDYPDHNADIQKTGYDTKI